jgi:hypothetical protein
MTAYLVKLILVLFVLSVVTMHPVIWFLEGVVLLTTAVLAVRGLITGR